MSHFTLRMGDLFHFHPFASWPTHRKAAPIEATPSEIIETPSSSARDDLAFFSLSGDGVPEDSRAALERFGLVRHADADAGGSGSDDDEPWPLILM